MPTTDFVKKPCHGSHVHIYVLIGILYAAVGVELCLNYLPRLVNGNAPTVHAALLSEDTQPEILVSFA